MFIVNILQEQIDRLYDLGRLYCISFQSIKDVCLENSFTKSVFFLGSNTNSIRMYFSHQPSLQKATDTVIIQFCLSTELEAC